MTANCQLPAEADLAGEVLHHVEARGDPALAAELRAAAERARTYAARAQAPGTKRVYRSAWRQYGAWCGRLGFDPLAGDPEVVRLYLAAAGESRAAATLEVHLSAILQAHRLIGRPLDARDPRIATVMEGLRRNQSLRAKRQATPLTLADLRALVRAQPDTDLGLRNRALLLTGFGGALRRSEIVALDLDDLQWVEQGVVLTIRRSKTDQTGRGAAVAIARAADPDLCAARTLASWLRCRRAQIAGQSDSEGRHPLFVRFSKSDRMRPARLDGRAVSRLVKSGAEGCGLTDTDLHVAFGLAGGRDAPHYAGHSLRAGLLTAAAEAGVPLHDVMRHSRHRSVEQARVYMRSAELWEANASAAVLGGPEKG